MNNITLYCKDFDVTADMKEYLEEKLFGLLKYFNHHDVKFNVRMGKVSNSHNHGKIYYTEISIHTPEKNFGGRVESDSVKASIDLIKDELSTSITSYKEKSRSMALRSAHKFKEELHNTD